MHNRHTFALHVASLDTYLTNNTIGDVITILDKDLYNRVTVILRLRASSSVILFNARYNVLCQLDIITTKNSLTLTIQAKNTTEALQPPIVLYQGLTKKNVFEEIVYSAAQLGVATIVPVLTSKIHKMWDIEYERTRLNAIMLAACEQAKNFIPPMLTSPLHYTLINTHINKTYISLLLDPCGESLTTLFSKASHQPVVGYNVFLGAEGGLTHDEQTLLLAQNFIPTKLCTSILRSQDAALVSLGILRSF